MLEKIAMEADATTAVALTAAAVMVTASVGRSAGGVLAAMARAEDATHGTFHTD